MNPIKHKMSIKKLNGTKENWFFIMSKLVLCCQVLTANDRFVQICKRDKENFYFFTMNVLVF